MRAVARATAARTARVDPKFQAGPNELEKEHELKVLRPRNQVQQQQMTNMVKLLRYQYRDDPHIQNALALWQGQLMTGMLEEEQSYQFVRRFYFWLLGRGNDEDTRKTWWGRANAAVHNREVASYIQQFAQRRLDFALQLSLLYNRVPETLLGYWLYFKYIVGGELKYEKDAKGSFSFDISDDNYLADFELFQQHFGPLLAGSQAPAGKPGFSGVTPYPVTSAEKEASKIDDAGTMQNMATAASKAANAQPATNPAPEDAPVNVPAEQAAAVDGENAPSQRERRRHTKRAAEQAGISSEKQPLYEDLYEASKKPAAVPPKEKEEADAPPSQAPPGLSETYLADLLGQVDQRAQARHKAILKRLQDLETGTHKMHTQTNAIRSDLQWLRSQVYQGALGIADLSNKLKFVYDKGSPAIRQDIDLLRNGLFAMHMDFGELLRNINQHTLPVKDPAPSAEFVEKQAEFKQRITELENALLNHPAVENLRQMTKEHKQATKREGVLQAELEQMRVAQGKLQKQLQELEDAARKVRDEAATAANTQKKESAQYEEQLAALQATQATVLAQLLAAEADRKMVGEELTRTQQVLESTRAELNRLHETMHQQDKKADRAQRTQRREHEQRREAAEEFAKRTAAMSADEARMRSDDADYVRELQKLARMLPPTHTAFQKYANLQDALSSREGEARAEFFQAALAEILAAVGLVYEPGSKRGRHDE